MPDQASDVEGSEGFIRLVLVKPFVPYLRRIGKNPETVFARFGLSEDQVEVPTCFAHSELIFGLTNSFSELAGDLYLGVRIGESFELPTWPPFAKASENARSLADFFAQFVEVVPRESSAVKHRLIIEAERTRYQIERLQRPAIAPIQVNAFAAGIFVRVLKKVAQSCWEPSAVTWSSRHISGIPDQFYDIRVLSSDDAGMSLEFPTKWLSSNFPDQRRLPPTPSISPDIPITLSAAIGSALVGNLHYPSLGPDDVAKLLGIDTNRLISALKHQGTTFPREIKNQKIAAAKRMLLEDGLSVGQVGIMLGYSDIGHFSRFFRSQTGMSPTQFLANSRPSKEEQS